MENYIGFLGVYLLKVKEEIYYIQDLKLQMLVWYRRRELRLRVECYFSEQWYSPDLSIQLYLPDGTLHRMFFILWTLHT